MDVLGLLPMPLILILGLAGAIIGSFIGAVVIRVPRGETIVAGRSHCDTCGKTLGARELIPILSYLLQRGRCAHCHSPIAFDQPIAEVCGLVAGVVAALSASSPVGGAMLAVFAWALVALALIDARHFWLPDIITLPLIPLGLLAVVAIPEITLSGRLLGALFGYGSLEIVRRGYRVWRGCDGLGAGDAKLLGAIGAWLGVGTLPWIVLMAGSFGLAITGFRGLRAGTVSLTQRLPLGTFMSIAALVAIPITLRLIDAGGRG